MHNRSGITRFVLCQIIAAVIALAARAQHSDTVRNVPKLDSTKHEVFVPTHEAPEANPIGRSIDLALTGGAGVYDQGSIAPFQATANAEFYARSRELILTAGVHWGFSDPSTKGLDLGLRIPLLETDDYRSGIYADAELLFVDQGDTLNGFNTGLRVALAARSGWLEGRMVGEIRNFGPGFSLWAGVELGVVLNLTRETIAEPTPKDSLHAALHYIATSEELKELDDAKSEEEISAWLDRFWQKRNPSGSLQNDMRDQYMSRVAYANDKFGTPRRMGVSTDRGRVLLIYGWPDRIEYEKSVLLGSDRQFELWVDENRVQGYRSAFFLFLNGQEQEIGSYATGAYEGHGDYRQIYSNIPGEYSEGIPGDLPKQMLDYIESFH